MSFFLIYIFVSSYLIFNLDYLQIINCFLGFFFRVGGFQYVFFGVGSMF